MVRAVLIKHARVILFVCQRFAPRFLSDWPQFINTQERRFGHIYFLLYCKYTLLVQVSRLFNKCNRSVEDVREYCLLIAYFLFRNVFPDFCKFTDVLRSRLFFNRRCVLERKKQQLIDFSYRCDIHGCVGLVPIPLGSCCDEKVKTERTT